jgi:hypothetical protein
MKGVLYNLTFKGLNNDLVYNDLNMIELIKTIKECYNNEYNINESMYNLNNQIIYNLINNRKTNKLLNYCKINKA